MSALTGELPTGVAVLEASAGTGKTWTIAGLAARYVAAGVPLEQLLVVSFTRAATGELRERVRDRLVSLERALEPGAQVDSLDEVAAGLLAGGDVAVARERIVRALADFDAATITTTHGFCLEALGSLGFAGDVERDCALEEDVDDLVTEVVDALYVRAFVGSTPQFSRGEAGAIARAAIAHPSAALEPAAAPPTSVAGRRVRLAQAARDELEARKRAASVMTYDDLLTRLDATLSGPGGAEVARRLQARYSVVLVDEFQDTDPVQWRIFHRAFGAGTLVLIGDPKQAIYAFRGADVYAYLEAAHAADTLEPLSVNWRSDADLLKAYDVLFGGAKLGHPEIAYRSVEAAPGHEGSRLRGAPSGAPLRIRLLPRTAAVTRTRTGYVQKDSARRCVVRDLAADVVRLLESEACVGEERVRPGDVAVLVRRNVDAAAVRAALEEVGVPAVINGAGSVFSSDGAASWLALLEALERPGAGPRAHRAALTPLLGWSAERVALAGDAEWEEVHARLHRWAAVLREDGVAALAEAITHEEGLPARLLGIEDGERELTDLRHVAQLLHAVAVEEHLGTAALTSWLRRRIAEAETEADEERSRRLESDAAAVQVLTVHRAKGLEFPVVHCPFLWDPTWIPDEPGPLFFHDPDAGDQRTLDVGLDGPDQAAHARRHREELRGEDLRLLYVALTRARHQAVVWWPSSWDAKDSPLGRLVFARGDDGTVAVDGGGLPSDAAARARFEELAALAPGCIAVEDADPGLGPGWHDPRPDGGALSVAAFTRSVDETWRRTSYSDITAFAEHEVQVASESEDDGVEDEPDEEPLAAGGWDELPGGTRFGTLVHDVLQDADFAATSLEDELAARVAEGCVRRRFELDQSVLVAGLADALRTPLGDVSGGAPLVGVARADRLDELSFELPLALDGHVRPGAIGALLREHLSSDDPLAAYADRLDDPALRAQLRGYLTGSIDLAWRLGDGRFAVVDYKTNRLPAFGGEALAEEMRASHYALQALLYTVALHRYLRWRVPGHDPERDIAGVLYLFLRGMPAGGVFGWRPPGALVVALSDLLDRGDAA